MDHVRTGMMPDELWGRKWKDGGNYVHVLGTKRTGRDRKVPRLCTPTVPLHKNATSFNRVLGLDELSCESSDAYRETAIELGRDAAKLADIRHRLERQADTGPLFDKPIFVRGLERALAQVVARSRAGEPPANVDLPPDPDGEWVGGKGPLDS